MKEIKIKYECNRKDCQRKCILKVRTIEEIKEIVPLYCSFALDEADWKIIGVEDNGRDER